MVELAVAKVLELPFATELATRLRENGRCNLQYVTAEMQPFSNAQRPDVVYTPESGSFSGQTIFIEVKISLKRSATEHIEEHFQFAQEYMGSQIFLYLFVTNEQVSDLLKRRLKKKRIYVIDHARSVGDVLAAMDEMGL